MSRLVVDYLTTLYELQKLRSVERYVGTIINNKLEGTVMS